MSKRTQTTATFAVTVIIPTSSNCQELAQYIRDAIQGWKGGLDPESIDKFKEVSAIVSLQKKVTTYG